MRESIIYVRLLDEGVDVWRPVAAEQIEHMIYRILPVSFEAFETEMWEFPAGALVQCREIRLTNGKIMGAVNLLPST